MPLIKCPDCGKDLSDQAPACVNCGRPMTKAPAIVQKPAPVFDLIHDEPVTIEQTGKKYKLNQALGGVLIFAGLVCLFAVGVETAVMCWVIGVCLAVHGMVGQWWYHA